MAEAKLRRVVRFHGDAVMSGGKTGAAAAGAVSLLLGGSVGALTAWLANVSWLLAALVATASFFFFYAWGAYRVWDKADEKRQEAESGLKNARDELEAARSAAASAAPAVKLMENNGLITGSEIHNTNNTPAGQIPGSAGTGVQINPGVNLADSSIRVLWGTPPPAHLPAHGPSTPDERIRLRDQLLELAAQVDEVMAPWRESTVDVARQMGIPEGEFMARLPEIRAEYSRISGEVTARYNDMYRSAVIQAYGRARSIGFADADMERDWQTRHGARASHIPALLRRIAARIPD